MSFLSKFFTKDLLPVLFVWMFGIIPASADSLSSQIVRKGDVVIFNSAISEQSYERLVTLYNDKPFSAIAINSDGGEYDAGMKIANFVYKRNIGVYVPKYCASACTFVFFGAPINRRDIAPDALLGLHNVSLAVMGDKKVDLSKVTVPATEAIELAQKSVVRSGMMIAFYSANGIPSDVLLEVAQSFGRKVVNIQRGDLIRWGSIELE